MDPLSIATSAASLAISAFRLSNLIYSCVDDIKSADATLLQLQNEVNTLHSALQSVASTFKSDDLVRLCESKSHNQSQSVKLLMNVKPLLQDCKNILDKLDGVLGDIGGKPGRKRGLLQLPAVALKINFKSKDIEFIRHQIRSYISAMQLTLQMVGICLSIDSNKQVESLEEGLNQQLATLAAQISDVQKKVSDINDNLAHDEETPFYNLLENDQRVQHLEDYIQSAKMVYSNASIYSTSVSGTVIGDSADTAYMTETFASVLGLNDEKKEQIYQWLPGEQLMEGESSNFASQMISLLTDLLFSENNSDEDEDLTISLFKARLAIARKRLETKNYKAAEKQFRSCLAVDTVMKTLPLHEVVDLKVELASACQGSGNKSGQQEILLELLALDISTLQVLHLQHTLALAYVNDSKLDLARQYAEQAMAGRRKLLGRRHESYYESVSLLVEICAAQNDIDDADVYRHLLPLDLQDNITLSPVASPGENAAQPVASLYEAAAKPIISNKNYAARTVASPKETAALQMLSENGYDIDDKQSYFEALIWAEKEQHQAIVLLLLERGSDIIARDVNGDTLLMWTSKKGLLNATRRVLDQGADIEAKGAYKSTALIYASQHGYKAVVQLLLDRGARVDHGDTSLWTALHYASATGYTAVVRLLLDRGANVNAQDLSGYTALLSAAENGSLPVVKLLVEGGANVHHRSNIGRTALDIARERKHGSVTEFLNGGTFKPRPK